ncbi:MAG: hypothetical protein HN919_01790 [Verrucomicrobia bacterium]|mgnify:CR=1 FL=1|jgi:hypothetical protein|nr:hypothetical protein [Verrucomicrobiota bacterium]MBT7065010.1 hypothetical protein [Verrucomicrobiota bacterium]
MNMMNRQTDLKAWEEHLKKVFPFSDALERDDLFFTDEYGQPVLSIKGHRYFVKFVQHIKDSLIFIPPTDHYPPIYLAEHISLKKAESMREANTAFIDTKGNAFLNLPDLYLFVMGRSVKAESPLIPKKAPTGKLFKKTGIKLVYALLTDPRLDKDWGNDLLNVSVRELADKARMSTGSISELVSEMKERGFLLADGRFKRLVNRKVLVDQWLHGYMDYRFTVKKQCFEAESISWWHDRKPESEGFLWGGEPAAAILTDDFLRPERLTLYTNRPLYDLVVDGALHQTPSGGNVEFIEPLMKTGGDQGCVHPLLVYADLICSSDDRNTETATRIHDRYLQSIIEAA